MLSIMSALTASYHTAHLATAASRALPPRCSAAALEDARARAASSGRKTLANTLQQAEPRELELAALLAAEERPLEPASSVLNDVDRQIETLVDAVSRRLRLAALLDRSGSSDGEEPEQAKKPRTVDDPRTVATAVSRHLFGSGSAADDAEEAFFQGNVDSYYDPDNSFLDRVLERRQGIPISLSLVYLECCRRLGLQLVGLNAPRHLLLAPADTDLEFVIDPFVGTVMDSADAALFVALNAGFGGSDAAVERGAKLLAALRGSPMPPHAWCARMLRNLRAVHARDDDVCRTLGACERLRLVGKAAPGASSPAEQVECAVQLCFCIYALRWDERRDEARFLLSEMLEDPDPQGDGVALTPAARERISELLEEDWFDED
tara:strand:+ start:2477 stop:3610 length:1134 start_codon:yes stop_codon:yes gene_type:complete